MRLVQCGKAAGTCNNDARTSTWKKDEGVGGSWCRLLSLGRRHLVNAYEVKAGIGVIAVNTVWSMPEHLRGFTTRRYISPLYVTLPTLVDEWWCTLQLIQAGTGTTVVQHMREKRENTEKKLCCAFVDLAKVFDRVPRGVSRLALRKADVAEWLVKAVNAMHWSVQMAARMTERDAFDVTVRLRQASVYCFPCCLWY